MSSIRNFATLAALVAAGAHCFTNIVAYLFSAAPEERGPRGVMVHATVKGFVPVTDETLENPDPSDWVMQARPALPRAVSRLR